MIGDLNDETNFQHKSLLTDTQVSRLCKAFANNSSANTEFSKIPLSKMLFPEFLEPLKTVMGSISGITKFAEFLKKMKHAKSDKDIPEFF